MADIDRYTPGRRYQGGGGGGGNRKRRYQGDDDDRSNAAPPDRGGDAGHHRSQRRRFDPPGTRLRKKFLSLLDSSFHAPEADVAEIASLAAQHGADGFVRDTFCDLALSLAVEQPAKTVFVAAAVQAVARERPELVEGVLERAGRVADRAVTAGRWGEVKLVLRLLACLQGVVEGEGVLVVLDELFQRAVELQHGDPEETVGPELVKVVLLTIPYLMVSSATGLEEKVAELLQKTDVVASTPHALEGLVDPYPEVAADRKSMACPSLLSILQKQLESEAQAGWPLACMPKILQTEIALDMQKENGDANGDENGDANGDAAMSEPIAKHAFPDIKIPEAVNPGQAPLFPEIYYSVFADQQVESVPPTTNIASTIIRDAFVDTINLLDYNRSVVGKFIIELDNYWAPDTFIKRATPFDKLHDVPAGKPTWKPEDMAIDAVFAQMMRLPAPAHKAVYYNSIIMEACKLAPSAIAPSLGRAIRFTFRSLETLDQELVERFTHWFAHHVSNFEFRWKWSEWIPDIDLPDLHPRKAFINSAIDKEMRLSFPKRIVDSLPAEFASLISKGAYNDQPDFKFASDKEPYAVQGQAVLNLLRDKGSADELLTPILDEVRAQASAQGIDPSTAAADVFVTSICHVGSKSLSHILSSIEKNRGRLLSIGAESEPARRQIITSVMSYWQHHRGQAINIIDKLLNYTIVTPQSVVDWALADGLDSGRALARHEVFEMVWTTMGKVARRVRDIASARANPEILRAGDDAQRTMIADTLVKERDGMRALLAQIDDAAAGVEGGGDEGGGDGESAGLLRAWGAKWRRTWARRASVEERFSSEAGVETLVRVLALVEGVEREARREEDEEKAAREEARRVREEERKRRWEEEERARGGGGGGDDGDDGRGRGEGRGVDEDAV